jgi:Cu/Ag efflux protein CusF
MKRIEWSALAALAVVFLLFGGKAQAQSSSGFPLVEKDAGKVQSVDVDRGTITLTNGERFAVATRGGYITKDDDPARLSDIKPGDELKASFTDEVIGGAARVEVSSPRSQMHEAN